MLNWDEIATHRNLADHAFAVTTLKVFTVAVIITVLLWLARQAWRATTRRRSTLRGWDYETGRRRR